MTAITTRQRAVLYRIDVRDYQGDPRDCRTCPAPAQLETVLHMLYLDSKQPNTPSAWSPMLLCGPGTIDVVQTYVRFYRSHPRNGYTFNGEFVAADVLMNYLERYKLLSPKQQ